MFWGLAHDEVKQLGDDSGQDNAHQKTFDFIPYPGSQPQIGKLVTMLKAEAVVVQPQTQNFRQHHEHQDIEEYGQAIVLKGSFVGDISQAAAPSGCQQCDHQDQPQDKVGYAETTPDAVVATRFRRIGGEGTIAAVAAICLPDYRIAGDEMRDPEVQWRSPSSAFSDAFASNKRLGGGQNFTDQFRR